jgi:hypothetical protein
MNSLSGAWRLVQDAGHMRSLTGGTKQLQKLNGVIPKQTNNYQSKQTKEKRSSGARCKLNIEGSSTLDGHVPLPWSK